MADYLACATFPGITLVKRLSFTLSRGISPSICTIEILPQASFVALIGNLVLVDSNGLELVFPNCRINSSSFDYNNQGMVWRLAIWDRRWMWSFGSLSGHYNQRFSRAAVPITSLYSATGNNLPAQCLDGYTTRTPQQLAVLCLQAMGETNYDISQVPNTSLPQMDWEADNPAQALATLAERMGCQVVLRLDNSVQVAQSGVGALLPIGSVKADAQSFQIPNRPDSIQVACGKTRYQVELKLEAVGKDVDGSIVPIAQLTYTPPGGWGNSSGGGFLFPDVPGFDLVEYSGWPNQAAQKMINTHINPHTLAMQTVFRWYRITMVAVDDPTKRPLIPGWTGSATGDSRLSGLWQILPIEDVQIEGYFDSNGEYKSFPAAVYGTFDAAEAFTAGDPVWGAPVGSYYNGSFSIDTERGIVQFDEQIYQSLSGSGITAVQVAAGGAGYNPLAPPAVAFVGGNATVIATAQALLTRKVVAITVIDGGAGYVSAPMVMIVGGGGLGATATATISGGAVTAIAITSGGHDYDTLTAPQVQIVSNGSGGGAVAIATTDWSVDQVIITNPGAGYTSLPTVAFVGGAGAGATATAIIGVIAPAVLYLRCAVSPRNANTLAWDRHTFSLYYPDPVGTLPRILKHDEITLNVVPIWNPNAGGWSGTSYTNQPAVDAEASYYLAAAALEYQITEPQEREYIGLCAINLDGCIQQVTWSMSGSGYTTRASRGTEWNPAVPSYRERRLWQQLQVTAAAMPRLLSQSSPGGR